jgi:DNA-binding response OmpR family regulator
VADHILLVEDDSDAAALVSSNLQKIGFSVDHVENGVEGLDRALGGMYSLVILDWNLPGLDGMEVCRKLRAAGSRIPLLMLTARTDEIDRVLGLEIGADDYIAKPFSMRELLARVRCLLRRAAAYLPSLEQGAGAQVLIRGELRIDLGQRSVTLEGRKLPLTLTEFEILALLASSPGWAYPRNTIAREALGYDRDVYEMVVSTHVQRLRKKLEPDPEHPRYVLTGRGVGYRFPSLDELNSAKSGGKSGGKP